jgi:hypothetical protein
LSFCLPRSCSWIEHLASKVGRQCRDQCSSTSLLFRQSGFKSRISYQPRSEFWYNVD